MPVLVEGYAQDFGIMPEDLLGAVAVMHIRIDHREPLMAVFGPQVLHQYGHVIDIAKSPVAVHHPHAVVAWRAHQGKAISDLPFLQGIGQGEGASGGNEMGLGHLALHIWNAEMGASDVLVLCQSGLVLLDLREVHQPLLKDLVPGIKQPLLSLWMGGRDGPVEGGEEYQAGLSRSCIRSHLRAPP